MITIITPSIRESGLDIVKKCLDRQTYKDFEWIVCTPYEYNHAIHVPEPIKKEGETYNLNKCWNRMIEKAKGELIVSITDLIWFPPDTLERLWLHYEMDNNSCVGGIGHQYDQIENGKPEHLIWTDPRARTDFGTFYEIKPNDYEMCLASIPLKAIVDVGGFDEEFDKYAALSEKEMCLRIDLLGYKFYLDQTLEYRAVKHPRLTSDWDEKYFKGWDYFNACITEIQSGKRKNVDFLKLG